MGLLDKLANIAKGNDIPKNTPLWGTYVQPDGSWSSPELYEDETEAREVLKFYASGRGIMIDMDRGRLNARIRNGKK